MSREVAVRSESTRFDYSSFDAETRGKLICIAASVQKHRKAAIGELMDIAADIAKAHGVLAGGGCEGLFAPWVESECNFKRTQAYRLIDIWSVFGDYEHIASLDDSAIRRLADRSTPDDVVAWAKRTGKSKYVTLDMVKDRLAEWVHARDKDDEPAADDGDSVDEEDTGIEAGCDDTSPEDDGFDSEVDLGGGMEGGGGDWGAEDEQADETQRAPVDLRKWEAWIRKGVNLIDEIAIAADVSGDRREAAKEHLRKLDAGVKRWAGR
jgi:hypothetical protein